MLDTEMKLWATYFDRRPPMNEGCYNNQTYNHYIKPNASFNVISIPGLYRREMSDFGTGLKPYSTKKPKGDWRREQAKKKLLGKEYCSPKTRKTVPPRKVGPACRKCRFHCPEKVSLDARTEIFQKYWDLASVQKRREYLVKHISTLTPSNRCTAKKNPRGLNGMFFLTTGNVKIRVCKNFFSATLGISDKAIRTARAKLDTNGFLEEDKRGKHDNRPIALDKERKERARNFFNSIPRIESHYLRAQTSREFIEGSKTLNQLYRDYTEIETQKGNDVVSLSSFKRMFYTEYNISMFQPKKEEEEI